MKVPLTPLAAAPPVMGSTASPTTAPATGEPSSVASTPAVKASPLTAPGVPPQAGFWLGKVASVAAWPMMICAPAGRTPSGASSVTLIMLTVSVTIVNDPPWFTVPVSS